MSGTGNDQFEFGRFRFLLRPGTYPEPACERGMTETVEWFERARGGELAGEER